MESGNEATAAWESGNEATAEWSLGMRLLQSGAWE